MICTVEQGKSYFAKIEIPWLARAFANEHMIEEKLKGAGFADVQVQNKGGGVYYAWGRWPFPNKTEDVDYVTEIRET